MTYYSDAARLALARRECANVMFQLGYSHEEAPGVWGAWWDAGRVSLRATGAPGA